MESATGRNQYVLTVRNTFEPLSLQVTRSYGMDKVWKKKFDSAYLFLSLS